MAPLFVASAPGVPYLPEEEEDYSGPEYTDDAFPNWTPATSRVISGPLGSSHFAGTRQATWQEAKAYCEGKYSVIKFWTTPGRWYARIRRDDV